jgi:hypothetical protein
MDRTRLRYIDTRCVLQIRGCWRLMWKIVMSEGPRLWIWMSFGVFLYKCTDVSDEPAVSSVRVHSLTYLRSSYVPNSERNIYVVKYVFIYNRVHVKSKFPSPGIWSATASPPRRLCYRPTLFFLQLNLSFHCRKEKSGARLKMLL